MKNDIYKVLKHLMHSIFEKVRLNRMNLRTDSSNINEATLLQASK